MQYSTARLGDVAADITVRGRAREYLRWGLAGACAEGNPVAAAKYFEKRWPLQRGIETFRKAAVAPGTTTGWGSQLAVLSDHSEALVEMLRPLTVVGRMQGFRRVPFNVQFPRVTAGSSVSWVGQASVRPASRLSLDQIQFEHSKISGIVVFTKELAQNSDPAVENLIRSDMTAAIAQFTDEAFLDPTLAGEAGVSPASITNGTTEITSTGTTASAAAADLKNLFDALSTNLVAPYLIMKPTTAVALASLGDTFPKVGANGGEIWGVPVLTSGNAPADNNSPSNEMIILIDTAEVLLAEGDIEFRTAQHATLQMESSPDSPATASTVLTSLWQRNLIGIGVNRFIRWERRREGSVAYLSGVSYG